MSNSICFRMVIYVQVLHAELVWRHLWSEVDGLDQVLAQVRRVCLGGRQGKLGADVRAGASKRARGTINTHHCSAAHQLGFNQLRKSGSRQRWPLPTANEKARPNCDQTLPQAHFNTHQLHMRPTDTNKTNYIPNMCPAHIYKLSCVKCEQYVRKNINRNHFSNAHLGPRANCMGSNRVEACQLAAVFCDYLVVPLKEPARSRIPARHTGHSDPTLSNKHSSIRPSPLKNVACFPRSLYHVFFFPLRTWQPRLAHVA